MVANFLFDQVLYYKRGWAILATQFIEYYRASELFQKNLFHY